MQAVLCCGTCGTEYPLTEPIWRCNCGGILDIVRSPVFSLDRMEPWQKGLWKFQGNLPVDRADRISLGENQTPLLSLEMPGGYEVLVKQEQLFSTGSYKDRGAAVLISHVKSLGIDHVVEDSSGNAGCAIAAYSARAGICCDIYVPEDTSPGKLAQIQWYGANLIKVPGSREDTADAVLSAAKTTYYASHTWNPFFLHGTKTFAFEVCEDLGWTVPDWVVLPVGNGTLLLGAAIGFQELRDAKIISRLPKICAVQASNCSPLAEAFDRQQDDVGEYQKLETIAEGIAIARPVRGKQILQAVKESQGLFVTISEDEIQRSLDQLGKMGFFIEPTAAATIAGLQKVMKSTQLSGTIVSVFTGHGLKATEKFLKILEK